MISMPSLPFLSQDQDIAFSFWCEGLSKSRDGDDSPLRRLAAPELLVTGFTVDEVLFGLTRVEILLTSRSAAVDLQAMMDTKATLTIHHKYRPELRHFSGVVVEAERGDTGHHRTAYRVTLLPALARLDHGSDCRVFQKKTTQAIVTEIFQAHGIMDVKWDVAIQGGANSSGADGSGSDNAANPIRPSFPVREYCVQYRETHLAFIERLLSEEGMFYFFTHGENGASQLVICDAPEVQPACPSQDTLTYNAMGSGVTREVYCSSLTFREKLRSTAYTQRDYTFLNPPYGQEHTAKVSEANGVKDYRLFDYPGRYKQDAAGKPFTRSKLEATRTDASLAYGVANAPHLIAGHTFTLEDHPDKAMNVKWRLLAVRHEGTQPQAFMEDGMGTANSAPRLTTRPLSGADLAGAAFGLQGSKGAGLQSAASRGLDLATQASGASANPTNANTTGTDTSVNATVYACAFTAQPARLPYRPTQKTKPLVDGPQIAHVVGPPGEEIFTDKYGRVKIQFPWDRYGEKNERSSCWVRVASNWAGALWGHVAIPRIGQEVIVDFLEGDPDQPIIIGRTYDAQHMPPYELPKHKTRMTIQSKTHKGNGYNELRFEDEKGNEQVYVHSERDFDMIVENDRREWIRRHRHLLVDGKRVEEIKGGATSLVAEDRFTGTGEKWTVSVGDDHAVTVGKKHSLDVGESVYVKAGQNLVLEAPEITIRAPGGFIKIDNSGITILGQVVNINSGGSPGDGVPAAGATALNVEKADSRKG